MHEPMEKRGSSAVAIGLLIGLALAIRLVSGWLLEGHINDQRLFVEWIDVVRDHGFRATYIEYQGSIDYPPVFLMVMHYYARGLSWFGIVPRMGTLSFKGVLVLVDMAAIVFAIVWSRRIASPRWRMFTLALLALNPALITDSAVWGQVDMLHSMLMVMAILLLPGYPACSGAVLVAALLTKFQAVVVVPVIGFWLLRQLVRERAWRPAASWLAGLGLMALLAVIYFGANGSLEPMLRRAYFNAVGHYPYASMNGFNIWFDLVGVPAETNDTMEIALGLSLRRFGLVLLSLASLYVGAYVLLARAEATALLLKAATAINFAFFMLPTEIHERYSVPALVFALFAMAVDKRWCVAAIVLTVTTLANLLIVLYGPTIEFGDGHSRAADGIQVAVINAGLLLLMFADLGRAMWLARSAGRVPVIAGGQFPLEQTQPVVHSA